MIPKNITEQHVLQAINDIDVNGIKYPLTKSKKYDLLFNSKTYPPKLTISLANQFANEEYLSHLKFNTNEAQNYLKNLSPNFIIQKKEVDAVQDLVNKYKEHVRENKLEGEIYKWRLLGEFKGRPDVNAVDFYTEIKGINYFNLIYPVGLTVIHTLAKERPEPYRACFKVLLDESKDLDYRLKYFTEETLIIYREIEPNEKLSHHQDERTMATFLTYFNPDKYTFYKDSFYQKYCKLLGVESKKKGEKYLHYLELIDDFINEYINDDSELLKIIDDLMLPEYFQDSNRKVLAQDILYQILDKLSQSDEVVALMASDTTGWQDDHIEETENSDASIIWNSRRPSGTNETLKFLRNIIDEGNSFNLYYCYGGNVHYRATIIDFVENQAELDTKEWQKLYKNILYYRNKFTDYKDKNKSASIVFLAKSLEEVNPISVKEFKFYKGYDVPRHDNLSPVKHEPEIIETEFNNITYKNINKMENKRAPLNQILFGPPGTGKTYSTINKSLEIVGVKTEGKTREEIKKLFDDKMKEGQIVFTTFHQSMSYEDFIEGIKPEEPKSEGKQVNYKIIDGIFKAISKKAKENQELAVLKTVQTEMIPFDTAFEMLTQKIQTALLEDPVITPNEMKKGLVVKSSTSFFSIIGINGSSIRMMTRTGNEQNTMTKPTLKLIFENLDSLDKYISGGMSTYYRALVEEMYKWKEEIKSISKNINSQNYVLIIDEINRGNVSQVFGELITLIEDDKRIGRDEALEATLTYSKEKFGIPSNLYIIGTMNTADRSVEALDAALRRRFSFEEISPKPGLVSPFETLRRFWIKTLGEYHSTEEAYAEYEKDLRELLGQEILDVEKYIKYGDNLTDESNKEEFELELSGIINFKGINLAIVLSTINKRIEKLLDKDHQIGHSYFMNVWSLKDLKLAFHNKIIPLLQEYFFGDYSKIGLVLGKGFVRIKEWDQNGDSFADFDSESSNDFDDKDVYELIDYTNEILDYTIEINKKAVRMDFVKAIQLLLKQEIE